MDQGGGTKRSYGVFSLVTLLVIPLSFALATRGDRWLAAGAGAALVAGVPVAAPLAPGLLIAVAVGAGLAVASFLGRAPAVRHQVVAAASVLALVASATWLG